MAFDDGRKPPHGYDFPRSDDYRLDAPRTRRRGEESVTKPRRARHSSRQTSASGLLQDFSTSEDWSPSPSGRHRSHTGKSRDAHAEHRSPSHRVTKRGGHSRSTRSSTAGRRSSQRLVSGLYPPDLEKGGQAHRSRDHDHYHEKRQRPSDPSRAESRSRRRKCRCSRCCMIFSVVIFVLLLIIIVVPAVVVSRKRHDSDADSTGPSTSNLNGISPSSIPPEAQGTYLDPFTWYDTSDFNVTYTNATVGGLSIMGLNSTWDDNTRANPSVPPLNKPWNYGTARIHGMNLGGWLSLEPFITPSFFSPTANIIDEYTLTSSLGANASRTLDEHYATFIREDDFAAIQNAGFDHVRISFSYWAVTTYPGDPYVAHTSWRYLLRGIEWARQHGLRVNLDLHAAPGSQNGWNHSGRQGAIGWLNGPDGQLNADRTLAIHAQLAAFFAQPRYANIITMYGLLNEPNMIALQIAPVVNWTRAAISTVRDSGMPASTILVIGDGFLGLPTWHGLLDDAPNVLLDVHEYVVFNADQIALNHSAKLDFACQGWAQQAAQSMNPSIGFGNFLCGEWSQADTDCAPYVNNVGAGSRWEGTLDTGNATTSVLTPRCASPPCTCEAANADASSYSAEYKKFLRMFAEAQLRSFEVGWGQFYWTWATEAATQWSWKLGLAANILPADVTKRDYQCGSIPDFAAQGLSEGV